MGRGIYEEAWEAFSAFNATNVKELPLPPISRILSLGSAR